MASTQNLAEWALRRSAELDLRATKLSWVDEWCPGVVDFIVTIKVRGELFEGRGMAPSENLAFTKAVAEALERFIMRHSNLQSSNGVAVHHIIDSAATNAKQELVERDAFFCHWLTRVPFISEINPQLVIHSIGSRSLPEIKDQIQSLGVDLTVAQMYCVAPYFAFICVGRGRRAARPFGVHLGLGCDLDPNIALQHAIIEWLRTTVAWCSPSYRGKAALSRAEFLASKIKGPQQHELLAFSIESLGQLDHLLAFEPADRLGSSNLTVDEASIAFQVLDKPAEIADAPIYAVKAHSSRMQEAFFGYPSRDKVNIDRLREFSGTTLGFDELMHEPHPLG